MSENNELSEREIDVLHLLVTGASNKEIAQKLHISTNTVKVHLRNIYTKIEVSSRTEAVLFAVNSGLLPVDQSSRPAGTQTEFISPDGSLPAKDKSTTKPENWLEFFQTRTGSLLIGAGGILVVLVVVIILILTRSIGTGPAQGISSPADLPRWQPLQEMSSARSGLAVVAYDTSLYAIAGETAEGVSDTVEKYDPGLNSWQLLAPKPTPVTDISAAAVGGKIYVPGGRLPGGGVTDVLEIYDPRADQWNEGSSLPSALSAYSIQAFEGKLFLFGGWDGSEYGNWVYEYDPDRDSWRELPGMPTARAYAATAVAGGKIYIIGGYDGEKALTVNEVFSPARRNEGGNAWETSTSLPDGIYAMSATSIADILYVLGGTSDIEREFTALAFFTDSSEWGVMEEPDMPLGANLGAVSVGSDIYAVGGNVDQLPSSGVQVYRAIYTVSIPVIIK